MTIKDLLQKVSKVVIKEAPKTAETAAGTSKLVEYINKTFSKANIGKVAGKVAGATATANITDTLIKDVPVANNIYAWYAQAVDKFYESTVRKLPVVGDFLRNITDGINRLVIPNAQNAIERGRVNKPTFYTGLDMHTAFQIPMCYPDDSGVPFAGTKDFGSIAILKLGYNPLTSYTRIKARYTQLLDLLKGVRGLSGQLPYSEADLFFWDWNTKYLVLEYFRLKYALKLSRVYSLTKVALPKYVINQALGFDADDFIRNKADYIARLTDLHNFMRNSVPMFGVISERIEDLLYKLIPDSNDPKVALYYCATINMATLIPNDAGGDYFLYNSHFRKNTNVTSSNTAINTDVNTVINMTFATYNANLDTFMTDFPYAHKAYNALKGDLVGTFGTSVMWQDKTINEVETATADSMYHKFDELFLTQLQNGTILDRLGSDVRPSGTLEAADLSSIVLYNIVVPTLTNGVLSDMLKPRNVLDDFAYVTTTYKASNPEGSAGTIIMPQSDGCGFSTTVGYALTDETSIVANKLKRSEGEDLEITQLIAWFIKSDALYSSVENHDEIQESYQTQVLYIEKIVMLYRDNANGTLTALPIRPTAYAVGSAAIGNYTYIRDFMKQTQFWSQADYATKIPAMVYYSGTSEEFVIQDFNIMGSISHKAYQTAVKYSTYSQYAANLKVDDNTGKRINNIVEAYTKR